MHPESPTRGRRQHKSERDSRIVADGLIIGCGTSFVVICLVRDKQSYLNDKLVFDS